MKNTFLRLFVMLLAASGPLRGQEAPTWGREPVQAVSATRGAVVLNGLWKFQPGTAQAAATGWSFIPPVRANFREPLAKQKRPTTAPADVLC